MTSNRQAAYDAAAKVMARQYFDNMYMVDSYLLHTHDPDDFVASRWKSFVKHAAQVVDAALAA
jgi:hypothetical protein